jgi:hypothetical protein
MLIGAWRRIHQSNGRITRSTLGGGARKSRLVARIAMPRLGQSAWANQSGAGDLQGAFLEFLTGINRFGGTLKPKGSGNADGFFVHRWLMFLSVVQI